MTLNHSKPEPVRRLDVPSIALLLIGLVFGALALWSVITADMNPLVVSPSIIAIMIGVKNLTKLESPRQ